MNANLTSRFGHCPLAWMNSAQKEPTKGVFKKRCSENIQQISMAPEILVVIFPAREEITILDIIAQHCRVEVLKPSYMTQRLYLVCDQKYGTFYHHIKKIFVSYIIQKENLNEI